VNIKRVMDILSIPLNVGIVLPTISVLTLFVFYNEMRFSETGFIEDFYNWTYIVKTVDGTKLIVGYLIPFIVGQLLSAFTLRYILKYITSKN